MIVGSEARRERLRQALLRLPLKPKVNIEGALNALQVGTLFAGVNELPRMTTSRRKNGEAEELRRFVVLAARLRKHINSMHREALNSLSAPGERHALAVDCDLQDMIRRAEERIAGAEESEGSTSPKRLAPEQTAQLCAQIYTDLTGKRPRPHGNEHVGKKGGPYLRFVADIFAAVGIKGNAEHYGRDAEGADVIGGNGGVTMRKTPPKER